MTEKYLGAYTLCKKDGGYDYYPPFLNFTQVGDLVKVIVRARDKMVQGEEMAYPTTGDWAEMYMPKEKLKELLTSVLKNLS